MWQRPYRIGLCARSTRAFLEWRSHAHSLRSASGSSACRSENPFRSRPARLRLPSRPWAPIRLSACVSAHATSSGMSTECSWAEAPPPARRARNGTIAAMPDSDPVDAPVVRSGVNGMQVTESAARVLGRRRGGPRSARDFRRGSSSCVAICSGGCTCRRTGGWEIPWGAGSSSPTRPHLCAAAAGSCAEGSSAATIAACAPGRCDLGVLAGSAPSTAPPALTA